MTMVRFNNGKKVSPFDSLFSEFFNDVNRPMRKSEPLVNIVELDENFRIDIATPGFDKGDFKVSVENEVLTITGERKTETTEEGTFTRKEFLFTNFSRSFTLPESVDSTKIGAKYENGILMVDLPKREEAKPQPAREIEIG